MLVTCRVYAWNSDTKYNVMSVIGSCVLKTYVAKCWLIILVNTLDWHPDWYPADTLSTPHQQSVDSQSSGDQLIWIDQKLVDSQQRYRCQRVWTEVSVKCRWSINQGSIKGINQSNFWKFKVALNSLHRIFLNFAKSCILSCWLQFDNKIWGHQARLWVISA